MIAILWRYEVRPEHRARFEAAYGPSGGWAKLFARAEGFRGTSLLRSAEGSYFTLDRWRSDEDFDTFLAEYNVDYRTLDEATEGWTVAEERLGIFELPDQASMG